MTLEIPRIQPPIALQNSSLFLPETYTPREALLIDNGASGSLFEVGSSELGDYYYIRSVDKSSKNLIILNRNTRRLNLRASPEGTNFESIKAKLQVDSEHIFNPDGIAPLHRKSQEYVRDHWSLISQILKSTFGGKKTDSECFLEVALKNGSQSTEGVADAIGITSNGNIIIMEHTSVPAPSSNGSALKYRQVERHGQLFLDKYGKNLSVRPVCMFYEDLDEKTFFIKIGHANSSV